MGLGAGFGMRMSAVVFVAGVCFGAPCLAIDEGLLGEPALDEVLYGAAQNPYQFPAYNSLDILTQRNDNNRSGASHWPGVNQISVRQFRRIAELPVMLGKLAPNEKPVVTAQPLYVQSAIVRNVRQPVLIVATSNNVVYAFSPLVERDAPQGPLWSTTSPDGGSSSLGDPLMQSVQFNDGTRCDIGAEGARGGVVGIEATPVIDLANNQVLVGFRTAEKGLQLAAIDLNDGHVKKSIVIPVPNRAGNPEWHRLHRNRASLLLADGVVYLAFSSLCENITKIMHGSLAAFDARTLDHVGEFIVTDDHTDGGGVWQGATGPAADTDGNIYFVTGNRRLPGCLSGFGAPNSSDPDGTNLSNSVIRLKVEKRTAAGTAAPPGAPYYVRATVYSHFTPYRKLLGDCWDLDLGAAGPMLIPGSPYIAAGGKEGVIYILDRSEMGGYDRAGAEWEFANVRASQVNRTMKAVTADEAKHDRVHQKFRAGENTYDADYPVQMLAKWPHIHGTPVFGRFDADHAFMFVWPEKDKLKRFRWDGARFDPRPGVGKERAPPNLEYVDHGVPKNGEKNGMPGGMLSVNIDPTGPSLGVVLAAVKVCDWPPLGYFNPGYPSCGDQSNRDSEERGILRAYDPFSMEQVWCNQGEDYWFAKFVPPTVAAGRIFLPTASGKVIVYGPSSDPGPANPCNP
jgi:hypothetical protein